MFRHSLNMINQTTQIPKKVKIKLTTNNATTVEPTTTVAYKVLVVEDCPINMRVARLMLEKLGYEVGMAETGYQAITQSKGQYDAVLLDIGLPDIDGFSVCQAIRATEFGKELPIIAITAFSREDIEEQCTQAGVNEIINKPIFANELKEVLERWLKTKAKQRSKPAIEVSSPATIGSYKIIEHEYYDDYNSVVFKLWNAETSQCLLKTAAEITKDESLLLALGAKDAYLVGYMMGIEHTLKEQAELHRIAK